MEYWYGSKMFARLSGAEVADHNKFRLIRCKTWEELSHLLPDEMIPYYFTVHYFKLYFAIIRAEATSPDTEIYKIFDIR